MSDTEYNENALHGSAVFLRRFISSPRQVGSVAPSSRFLTRAMLDRVDWANAVNIAELGAGTGVFTSEIVKRARPDAKILVFEVDPALQQLIRDRHPDHKGLKLYGDAQKLCSVMRSEGMDELDFVISSLPFTVLPAEVGDNILNAVQDSLKHEGHFIAYQYSNIMKHKLEERFSGIKRSFVLMNIPPAFVFDCTGDKR